MDKTGAGGTAGYPAEKTLLEEYMSDFRLLLTYIAVVTHKCGQTAVAVVRAVVLKVRNACAEVHARQTVWTNVLRCATTHGHGCVWISNGVNAANKNTNWFGS